MPKGRQFVPSRDRDGIWVSVLCRPAYNIPHSQLRTQIFLVYDGKVKFVSFQFNHRGGSSTEPIMRTTHTDTGMMLSEPKAHPTPKYPPTPPELFEDKSTVTMS